MSTPRPRSSDSPHLPVCLVNGSLRGRKASSLRFLSMVDKRLSRRGIVAERVAVRARVPHGYLADLLGTLDQAGAVVLAFPLFNYCLPSGLMRLLEAWAGWEGRRPGPRPTRVYAIVNCAYPVPETNLEAMSVMRHFCDRLGLQWRGAIAIGGGPVAALTASVDVRLHRAIGRIVADIESEEGGPMEDAFLRPLLPRAIMDGFREHYDRIAERQLKQHATV